MVGRVVVRSSFLSLLKGRAGENGNSSIDHFRLEHLYLFLSLAYKKGFISLLSCDLGVDGGDVFHQIDDTSRVTVLVIVPRYEFDEVRVEHNTGIGIEDG